MSRGTYRLTTNLLRGERSRAPASCGARALPPAGKPGRRIAAALLLATSAVCVAVAAQPRGPSATRRATVVAALHAYPVFFHTQSVRVRGQLARVGDELRLTSGSDSVLVTGGDAAAWADETAPVEVLGLFLDVGRLESADPRLQSVDIASVWKQRGGRSWPGVGELELIVVERVVRAEAFVAPSVRALALEPERYDGQTITVSGRFRGRNLFADQPDAPGKSRWDFVLQSADASIWVVNRRPRGDGFQLDVEARVDTGKMLEVVGPVRVERHLVMIDATAIRLSKATAEAPPSEPVARVPTVGPAPEVVFSTPLPDETDVSLAATVRIQFSRDIAPATIQGKVKVGYLPSQAEERGEPQAPPIAFTSTYQEGQRVLEIKFTRPLDRFRVVRIELGEGITATDGAPFKPWTLTFTLGG